jgi:hypothetical protein
MNEMIIWFMGVQTTIIVGIIGFVCKGVYKRFDKIDERFDKIDGEIKEIRNDLHSIDKRLYGVEVMLHTQDCCVMKEDKTLKKAEGE